MGCCGKKIEVSRNEDLRVTYTPSKGYTFSTFTAKMQVREYEGAPDPPLLSVNMSPNTYGSKFEVVGSSLVLFIDKQDLALLPVADPISDPAAFVYDVIVTDGTGFSSRLVGGLFIVQEGVTR